MGARSWRKGQRGELELARLLSAEGFAATRGAQHRGGSDSPDVVCRDLPGLHFECKRCERLHLYDALEQAKADAGKRLPVVAHRRNGHEWVAILRLGDLLALIRAQKETVGLNRGGRPKTRSNGDPVMPDTRPTLAEAGITTTAEDC